MVKINSKCNYLKKLIKDNIISGVYIPGDRLLSERKLSALYNVSRTTVTIALKELATEKIIYKKNNCGSYISEDVLAILSQRDKTYKCKVLMLLPEHQLYNPFYRSLIDLLDEQLKDEVKVEVCFRHFIEHKDRGIPKTDIVLIFGNYPADQIKNYLRNADNPIVINYVDDNIKKYNYITADHFDGGEIIAEYLVKNNHRKIGCLHYGLDTSHDLSLRYQGILNVAKRHEIELNCLNVSGFVLEKCYYYAVDYLIKRDPSITAIICVMDIMALGVYGYCQSQNIRIPDDISVIGFDDQLFSRLSVPPLTSARVPVEAIAYKLSSAIKEFLISGKLHLKEVVKPVLVTRNSIQYL